MGYGDDLMITAFAAKIKKKYPERQIVIGNISDGKKLDFKSYPLDAIRYCELKLLFFFRKLDIECDGMANIHKASALRSL